MNTSHRDSSQRLLEFARQLRVDQSRAERILWARFRNRQFLDLKFRRQHPIEGYVVDFLCVEVKLIIELDGDQHFEGNAERRDERRDAKLMSLGFNIVRVATLRVVRETDVVLRWIEDVIDDNALLKQRPSPRPSPGVPGEGVKTPSPQPSPGVPGEGVGRRFDLR